VSSTTVLFMVPLLFGFSVEKQKGPLS